MAAKLIFPVYENLVFTASGPEDEAAIQSRLARSFREADSRVSYRLTLVAVQEQQVVGLILSFGGKEEIRLLRAMIRSFRGDDADIASWRETQDDEWYIDVLSVDPLARRQGIGAVLMHAAEELALQNGYQKMSLNVEPENTAAVHLYQHLGYQVVEQHELYGHQHLKMVKLLDGHAS